MKVYTCPHCGWEAWSDTNWVDYVKETNECPWCEKEWIILVNEQ